MRPMFSSFLLGESTQLQKSNLSAAERGLSEKGTKFVFCRFYCHIADWPLPRGQNLSAQRSAHRVYACTCTQHWQADRHRLAPPCPRPPDLAATACAQSTQAGLWATSPARWTGCAREGLQQHTDPRGSRWVWASSQALAAARGPAPAGRGRAPRTARAALFGRGPP
jgi:hypothetical protein